MNTATFETLHYHFPNESYLDKIDIDFGNLPKYVISEILDNFGRSHSHFDASFIGWTKNIQKLISSLPHRYAQRLLSKGIEYAEKACAYHKLENCCKPDDCRVCWSWEGRIFAAQQVLKTLPAKSLEVLGHSNPELEKVRREQLPIPELQKHVAMWLEEIYDLQLRGKKISFKNIWAKLHEDLPADFDPTQMDGNLAWNNGEEIQIMGVISLQKNYAILDHINKVITLIKHELLKNPEIENIDLAKLAETAGFSLHGVTFCLNLSRSVIPVYESVTTVPDKKIYQSINVGGNQKTFLAYMQFTKMEEILIKKSAQSKAMPDEQFSFEEEISISKKLDEMLTELADLKMGQEIIWTDLTEQINDLKSKFYLGKRTWKQLAAGKLVDMTASGVISETISKKIVEILKPFGDSGIKLIDNLI